MYKKLIITLLYIIFVLTPFSLKAAQQDYIYVSNLSTLTVEKSKLIYMETRISMKEDLTEKYDQVIKYIKKYGLHNYTLFTLYLDTSNNTAYKRKISILDLQKEISKQKKELENSTMYDFYLSDKYLNDLYGEDNISYKRKVIIGAIVNPSITFSSDTTFKTTYIPRIKGELLTASYPPSMDTNIYADKSNVIPFIKLAMLKYIQIQTNNRKNFLGMLEIYNPQYKYVSILTLPFSKALLDIINSIKSNYTN